MPVFLCSANDKVPVPYDWLRDYYPGTPDEYDSYEAAGNATAANGVNKVWECYVAGISPTNATQSFRTIVSWKNCEPRISWSRNLRLMRKRRGFTPKSARRTLPTMAGRMSPPPTVTACGSSRSRSRCGNSAEAPLRCYASALSIRWMRPFAQATASSTVGSTGRLYF